MKFNLCTADCVGNKANCLYPNIVEVTDAASLKEAVQNDHVCAFYKRSYRSIDNFEFSDVLPMDCDNDHTENADEWITPEKIHELLPDVSYAIVFSRNHMKVKAGKAARPKFHVYFLIDGCKDADYYAALKVAVYNAYPFFDDNALDAARFIFGADTDDVIWHEGYTYIDELVEVETEAEEEELDASFAGSRSIPAGQRNNTLSRYAARVLKRYGVTDKAKELFKKRAADCEEPLENEELKTIWRSAVKFFNSKVSGSFGYVPPDTYNDDFGSMSLKPDDFSDMGQAKVFVREYNDEIRYTDATDFIRFTGEYWKEYRMAAIGALEEFLDLQLQDAKDAISAAMEELEASGVDEGSLAAGGKALEKAISGEAQVNAYKKYMEALAYMKFVMKRRDYKYISSAANAAKPMVEIHITDLDKDGFLLNTPGMTIDLRKGMQGGYEPKFTDYITKQTTVCPGDEGKDLWLDALDTFFLGDAELMEYVQMIVGMAAIGEVFMEALIIAYGEGRNGKSTFWNTISNVLGTYSGTISAESLTMGCRHNTRPEMAELKGKRLVIAAELEDGVRLNTAVVKKLCSTDEIAAEKKYRDPFKYKPSHMIVLYTNHLPKVGVTDAGTWRRLIVIPFNAKIEGSSDIKNYTEYLTKNAGAYVMKWIIEGAEKAIACDYKFPQPACVSEAIAKYKESNDWLGEFIEECCEVDDSYMQKSGEFYQEYREYCSRTGEFTRSTTDFYAALDAAGYERKRTKAGVVIHGIRLKDEDFLD